MRGELVGTRESLSLYPHLDKLRSQPLDLLAHSGRQIELVWVVRVRSMRWVVALGVAQVAAGEQAGTAVGAAVVPLCLYGGMAEVRGEEGGRDEEEGDGNQDDEGGGGAHHGRKQTTAYSLSSSRHSHPPLPPAH
jgi:hypothetical protein